MMLMEYLDVIFRNIKWRDITSFGFVIPCNYTDTLVDARWCPSPLCQEINHCFKEVFWNRVTYIYQEKEWLQTSAPCNFFLQSHIKSQVFLTPRQNLQELCDRILLAFKKHLSSPNVFCDFVMAMGARVQKRL